MGSVGCTDGGGEDLFGEGGLVVSKIGNLPPLPPKIHCPVPDDSEEEAEP